MHHSCGLPTSSWTDARAGWRGLVALALWTLAAFAHADVGFAPLIAEAEIAGRDLGPGLASRDSNYVRRIVGLIADDEERGDLEVIFDGTQHFLPAVELATLIGARVRADDVLVFETPVGEARIAPESLFALDGELFVAERAIRTQLATPVQFDASKYALVLELPWWQTAGGARGRRALPEPDRKPDPAALSSIRLDYQYMDTGDFDRQLLDYRLEGSLAEGGWRVNVEQDLEGDTRPDEYFWLRAFENRQVLVGHQDVLPHPLLPSTPFTGGQVLFSNRPLDPLDRYGLTQSDFARSLARPQQDIRGSTQPGAIAELRVDGRVVARQRARLDGSYDFIGVELPSRGHADIEVLIFDRSYATLLDRVDHSRSSSQLLLTRGHQVFLLGGGAAGNALDRQELEMENSAAGVAQWRRGLSDRITAEAVLLHDGVDSYRQAGIVAALGARWVAALGMADDGTGHGLQSELAGFGSRWRFDYYGEERGNGFQDSGGSSTHDLRYEYRYQPTLWLGLRGRYTDHRVEPGFTDGGTNETFLLPGASWTPNTRLDIRLWPNVEGSYRLDSRYRMTPDTLSIYSYENERHTLELSHWRPSGVEYYARVDEENEHDARFETGARWSLDSDFRSYFQAAVIATDGGKSGYLLGAEKTLYPGFYTSLELRDEPALGHFGTSPIDDTRLVQLRFTADLSLAGRRLVPAESYAAYRTTGAIAGSVDVGDAAIGANDIEFNGVTLLVDGRPHTVPSRDGRYYLGNLRPGVYRVRLSQESLPIEVTPNEETYWVKVAQGSVTRVDFSAAVRFGAAGRLVSATGDPMGDTPLRIVDGAGTTITHARTDPFGLYRVDGLPPGAYRIEVEDPASAAGRDFTITDAFLFGIDLVRAPVPEAPGNDE